MICEAKQVSLRLLALKKIVADVGAAVFALDDAVCTNLTNVYFDTRCTLTEPHVKSGLQGLGDYTILRCGCPFCSYFF